MLFLGGSHEETNQENVGDERANLRHWVSPPTIGDRRLDATKLEQCADYAHQGSTGNETTGDECTLLATFAVHLGILATRGDIPVDGTTDQERNVQLQRDEHTQGECQGRNLEVGEHDGDDGTDAIENPRSSHTVHQWVDDRSHRVRLRSSQGTRSKSVSLVQEHHHAAYGSSTDQGAEELPSLLLLRGSTEPVTYLEV